MPRGVKLSSLCVSKSSTAKRALLKKREVGGFLPARDCARRFILPGEVQVVDSVACGIALCEGVGSSADGEVVVGKGQLLLDVERGFDKGGEKARGDVPLKMTVEKPNA